MWKWISKFSSPKIFYNIAGKWLPWLGWSTLAVTLTGLYFALINSPIDYQQKDSVRIMYVHVPAAWMSLFIYAVMAGCAFVSMVWKTKISHLILDSSISIGATFTFIALVTGALWGKPTWGTYWAWDARLVSELILFFLYCGIMALRDAIENRDIAVKAVNLLTLVGVVNLPIIHYSVVWWNTLHQGSSISVSGKSAIDPSMLIPLFLMAIAAKLYYIYIVLLRTNSAILLQEKKSAWVQQEVNHD